MLISQDEVIRTLNQHNIDVHGVLHIGAHECEEMALYNQMNISPNNIIWIDGNSDKVNWARTRGIPNVYHALITDMDDKEIEFHITNNGQSSSILELGTHSIHHPHIHYIETRKEKGITIDSFYERNGIDAKKYDFWNFDIQGAELMALKGATNALDIPKALYMEVNMEELYKGCGLLSDMDNYLSVYGFKRVLTKMTEHQWGDALYLKMST
jgi:hypothetical protein